MKYEVHEHCIISGPRSRFCGPDGGAAKIFHSHEGGDVPHEHAEMGPATFTVDKDEWFARTGYPGGGRKKFTKKPSGEQFELVAIDPADLEFDVIYCVGAMEKFRASNQTSTGSGDLPMQRMALAHGMKPRFKVVP